MVFFLPARLCAFLPLLLARRAITVPPPTFLLHLKADAAHLEGIQRKSQPRLAAIAAKRNNADCASTPDETTPPSPTPTRPSHAPTAYSHLPAPTAYAYSTSTRLLTLIVDWQTGDSPVDVPVLLIDISSQPTVSKQPLVFVGELTGKVWNLQCRHLSCPWVRRRSQDAFGEPIGRGQSERAAGKPPTTNGK